MVRVNLEVHVKRTNSNREKTLKAVFLSAFMFFVSYGYAEEEEYVADVSNSFNFKVIGGVSSRLQPLGTDLMGDLIDPKTGSLKFSHTDVSLPGNSSLDVSIRRVHSQGAKYHTPHQNAFGDWVLDLPIAYAAYGIDIHTVHPTFNGGCLSSINDMVGRTLSAGDALVTGGVHTEGITLHVPSKNLSGFQAKPKATELALMDPKNNWVHGERVTDYNNQCAEVAIAPDGTKYKFGRHTIRVASDFSTPYIVPPTADYATQHFEWGHISRRYAVLLITEVEDIHGNWVRYEYNENDELEEISSNDGRSINVFYDDTELGLYQNSHRIDYITTNGRRWDYTYSGQDGDIYRNLVKVQLPDGRYWNFGTDGYDMRAMLYEPYVYWNCVPQERTFSIKHPDGAVGTFTLRENRHIKNAESVNGSGDFQLIAREYGEPEETNTALCNSGQQAIGQEPPDGLPFYRIMSVIKKQISGQNIPVAKWEFEYKGYTGGSLDETWSIVTEPDGSKKKRTYQAVGENHGVMKRFEIYSADDVLLESIEYNYDITQPTHSDCGVGGEYGDENGACRLYTKRPPTLEKTTRYFDNAEINCENESDKCDIFTTIKTYDKDADGIFIDYGLPNEVTESNNLSSQQKVSEIEYWHSADRNIIGQKKKVSVNDTEVLRYVFYDDGSIKDFYEHGVLLATAEYHADGTLKKSTFNGALLNSSGEPLNTKRFMEYRNYKRGIPQTIEYSKRYSYDENENLTINREVDDNGWITSYTDLNDNTFGYKYDESGRILSIDNPDDDNEWLDVLFTWSEMDAEGGYLDVKSRTETRCELNANKDGCLDGSFFTRIVSLDGMLRPILTTETDGVNTRYKVEEWNIFNQNTFSGYWLTSSPKVEGTTREYDELRREKSISRTGMGTVLFDYLHGNKVEVTDAEDNETTTSYVSYGRPEFSQPKLIESPENVTTSFELNIFGNITSIAQAGFDSNGTEISATEYRVYDSQQRLCKVIRPETGTNIFRYNSLGEIRLKAFGVQGGENTDCEYDSDSGKEVLIVNDNFGDTWTVRYPDFMSDGTTPIEHPAPDVTYTRNNNGKIETLVSGNVTQEYRYNSLDLITRETLVFENKSFLLEYDFDKLGNLKSTTYPDGDKISLSPNGFGQATRVTRERLNESNFNYVSDVNYYPNGLINTFSYGNGISHVTNLDSAHLPREIYDSSLSHTALHYEYGYDNNQNVTSLTDNLNSEFSLDLLTYDGLNRLIDTAGVNSKLSSSITYDGLGNISHYTSFERDLSYTYNRTTNRLERVDHVDPETNYKSFNYDDFGNVSSNGFTLFSYNLANQLVSTGNGEIYLYDGFNRRIKKSGLNSSEYSLYNHAGQLLYRETVNGGINYIYLGNRLVAKDGIVPENSAKQHYRPFGESIEGAIDDVGYTGHKFDKSTGLNYMQARYYDPVIGRFYSNDPVDVLGHMQRGNSIAHGFNRYAYANNNPYKYTDPDGEFAWFVYGLAAVAAAFIGYELVETGEDIQEAGEQSLKTAEHTMNANHIEQFMNGEITASEMGAAETELHQSRSDNVETSGTAASSMANNVAGGPSKLPENLIELSTTGGAKVVDALVNSEKEQEVDN